MKFIAVSTVALVCLGQALAKPAEGCLKNYTITDTDSCVSVAAQFQLTEADFYSMNPGLHHSTEHDCDNLDTGKPFCVCMTEPCAEGVAVAGNTTEISSTSASAAESSTSAVVESISAIIASASSSVVATATSSANMTSASAASSSAASTSSLASASSSSSAQNAKTTTSGASAAATVGMVTMGLILTATSMLI